MKTTKRIMTGASLALGVYAALCALLALLLAHGMLAESGMRAWTAGFACAASLLGALAARGEGNRVVSAAGCAAAFWCAAVLIGMLAFPGEAAQPECISVLAPAILAGAALSLSGRRGKKRARAGGGRGRRLRK